VVLVLIASSSNTFNQGIDTITDFGFG